MKPFQPFIQIKTVLFLMISVQYITHLIIEVNGGYFYEYRGNLTNYESFPGEKKF